MTQYALRNRAERLISIGRVFLCAFFLVAIWLDPTQPAQHADTTRIILYCYLAFASLLALAVWRRDLLDNRLNILIHGIDLIICAWIMLLTTGPGSPFFIYSIFLLICATLRWHWQGTLWTALITITAFLCMAWFPRPIFSDPDFEMNRFVSRLAYLGVVATLLGYMGAHEQTLRERLARLAAWPRSFPADLQQLTTDTLSHCAAIIGCPRLVLL